MPWFVISDTSSRSSVSMLMAAGTVFARCVFFILLSQAGSVSPRGDR